jgi:hypothetical protein
MAICASCGRELEPAWKFCIHCGAVVPESATEDAAATAVEDAPATAFETAPETRETTVIVAGEADAALTATALIELDAPLETAVAPAAVALSEIPAAIRPDPSEREGQRRPRSRLDVPLLIGIVLGVVGVVLLAYIAIAVFGPHA